jgi:REP element-mobilizing transposase RayT
LEASAILIDEWKASKRRHGWHVGSYVIMPDHVHFFAIPEAGATKLAAFMGRWKEWTAKRMLRRKLAGVAPVWQAEFFDHLLRSGESCSEKWDYVRENPARAGLVEAAAEWPYSGFIDFQ